MENITIFKYIILSIILVAICVIMRVVDIIIIKNGNKKRKIINVQLPNGQIQKTETKHAYDTKAHKILFINMIVFASLATICIVFTAILNKIAIDYGVYGDYQDTITPRMVYEITQSSYKDQSNELPDDLHGKIIIYYRYDCKDCKDVRSELLAYLANVDTSDIYFVSSRSEKGKELLKRYYVLEVPSAIYIYNDPPTNAEYVAASLYESSETVSLFIKENFDDLLELKERGI